MGQDAYTETEKADINNLARIFYKLYGYEAKEGYDFGSATHPQEKSMRNLAQMAHTYFEPRFRRPKPPKTTKPTKRKASVSKGKVES